MYSHITASSRPTVETKYLIQHHGSDSQVVIIENQHPPSSVENDLKISVFTRNPSEGRFGLL